MQGLSRQFRRRVSDDLEMFTNQPFTSPLVLGDLGSLLRGGRFETATATTLPDLGIELGAPLVGPPSALRWISNRGGTTILTIKVKGAPPVAGLAAAEVGVHLQFGRKGTYYFEAQDAVISRIAETSQLHQAIASARRAGRISRRDRIVTAVCQARRAKLFIAQTKDAALTMAASAEFNSLVEAGVTFNTRRSQGSVMTMDIDAEQPVTFFMQLARVRRAGTMAPVRSIELADMIDIPRKEPEDTAQDNHFQFETVRPVDEDDLDDE